MILKSSSFANVYTPLCKPLPFLVSYTQTSSRGALHPLQSSSLLRTHLARTVVCKAAIPNSLLCTIFEVWLRYKHKK